MNAPLLLDWQRHRVARRTASTDTQQGQLKVQRAVIGINSVEVAQGVGAGGRTGLERQRCLAVSAVRVNRRGMSDE